MRVTVYRLTRLYRTRTEQLLDELLAAGIHTVDLRPHRRFEKRAITDTGGVRRLGRRRPLWGALTRFLLGMYAAAVESCARPA